MDFSIILNETSMKFDGKTAIYFNEDKISFSELDKAATAFAGALWSLGIKKGDRVGILLRNCPEYITAAFSILRIGAVVVPVNIFLTPPEIQLICDDSQMKCLFTSREFLHALTAIRSGLQYLDSIIALDIEAHSEEGVHSFKELLQTPVPFEKAAIDSNDDAFFFYTSGTTGIPKAAVLSHGNLISDVISCIKAINITTDDSFLLALPMFHSFCMTVNVLIPAYNGSSIVMVESVRSFENLIKATMANRPTIFPGVPQIFNLLANKPIPDAIVKNLPFRLCISGSAPLDQKTLNAFEAKFGMPLLEGYGLSEAAPVVSLNPPDRQRKSNSVGLSLPDIEVKILDDNGLETPNLEPGEIAVRGGNIMKRYHNHPDETAKALKDGWLHTGDIGYIDNDGYIYIIDRKKELIISKGMKTYPREIETLLYSNPKIQDAAVIGRKDEHKNETPVAFILIKEGESCSSKEIIEYLKPKLAPYKIPREIIFVKDLPRTATGKILKRELKAI